MQQIEKGEKTIPSRYTRPPAKKVNSLRRALGINRTVKRKEETTERTRDVAKLLAQPPYFCNRPTDGGTPWPASTDRSRFMVSLVPSRVPGGGVSKGGWAAVGQLYVRKVSCHFVVFWTKQNRLLQPYPTLTHFSVHVHASSAGVLGLGILAQQRNVNKLCLLACLLVK